MKHGQNTDSEGTLNRRKPRKRRLAAKEHRERKKGWEMEWGGNGVWESWSSGLQTGLGGGGKKAGRKWEKVVRVWV